MSDPVSALGGAMFDGFARVREMGPVGMITLRAKPDAAGLEAAIRDCIGTEVPSRRAILHANGRAAGWMSPDEFLLIMPYGETESALARIATHMTGAHHLAVPVSDARAMFRIEGARADAVMMKLAPADLDALAPGELRRTRVAQVAAAFWRDGDGFTLVCFRSVARYAFDLLSVSARQGSDPGDRTRG